ncbi:MAG: hypothetical protein E7561_03475 [Ruminococcaceae bacterium]|nr:hypothetical protein [Oscillospiraceae bacterium]
MENKNIDINSTNTGFVIEEDNVTVEPEAVAEKPNKFFKKPINFKFKDIKNPIKIKTTGFKSLGNIVKVIAFIVALAIIAVHLLAAYILFAFRPLYLSVCIAIVTFGLVVALMVLFLIYALGHSINQNNEILALLKSKNDKK